MDGTLQTIINRLPVMWPLYKVAAHRCMQADVVSDDVVSAIRLDPVIVARLLRSANSPNGGLFQSVGSIKNALTLLQNERTRGLFAAMALSCNVPLETGWFPFMRFWRHSIVTGLIAESIARHIKRYCIVDSDTLFCAGLLHDLGKLLFSQHNPDGLRKVAEQARKIEMTFFDCETGTTGHVRYGARISEAWNFPAVLGQAMEFHHNPSQCLAEHRRVVIIVCLADVMAHVLGFSVYVQEKTPQLNDEYTHYIDLPAERLRVIAKDIAEQVRKIETDFFQSDIQVY